jgi:hypothetical protein
MTRHPFDPVSAVLGVLALAVGIAVMVGGASTFAGGGGWWLAIAALVVGVALVPWRWHRTATEAEGPAAAVEAADGIEAIRASGSEPPVDGPTE